MQVWIGTSGYSFPDWVGPFYPPGTRTSHMFGYYARHFPFVELNFTFYRPPTAAMLARIAAPAPSGFRFIVKLPRTLSHERDAHNLPVFRQAVLELRQQERLAGLLCQLPQASHHDREHLAWLEVLAQELADCGLAVEFRHRSWYRPEIPAWLHKHGLDLVAVDVPDLPGLYPRGVAGSSGDQPPTGRRLYIRFHSRNAANWYQSEKERYDYDYHDNELVEWVDALKEAANRTDQALLLFNNCQRGQAAANAQRMRELLTGLAPEIAVVGPFAAMAQGNNQRLLFD